MVIRAGSGKGKGYLIQGIIAGIVIRKAEKNQITRLGIRYNEKVRKEKKE